MSRFEELDLVQVYMASGQLAAQVIKTKLESFGIPVLLSYESLGIVMGLTVDGLGEVRVLVPRNRAEEAQALLEEDMADGDGDEEEGVEVDEQ
jgi:hypothetical protein